jgi:hypothetical protein
MEREQFAVVVVDVDRREVGELSSGLQTVQTAFKHFDSEFTGALSDHDNKMAKEIYHGRTSTSLNGPCFFLLLKGPPISNVRILRLI